MTILGIETTCDETAVAIVQGGKKILANEVASQAALHAAYGGVFPELASREQCDLILPLVERAFKSAKLPLHAIDAVAVANGPGLMGSLLMGIAAASTLSFSLKKPLIGVNHVEAHLYSALMGENALPLFPALGVVLSGGHTFLTHIKSPTEHTILGTTVDDALGEAFDKVAILLSLSYPGGAALELLAQGGDPHRYPFKAGNVKGKPLHFSFSGLKTNIVYTTKKIKKPLLMQDKRDIAASFERAALGDILTKVKRAIERFPCQAIYFGGGVTANRALRAQFEASALSLPLYWPPLALTGDNGAMIAGLAFHLSCEEKISQVTPFPRLFPKASRI